MLVTELRRRWMTDEVMAIVIRRSYVLQDALQRMCRVSFDPRKQVVVGFGTLLYNIHDRY